MWKKTGKRSSKRRRSKLSVLGENRLTILGIFWVLGMLLVVAQLIIVQVLSHEKYDKIAQSHLQNRRELPAQRGNIIDRNGELIAVDLIYYSLGVRPELLKNPDKNARQLADIVKISRNSALKKIKSKRSFVYLKHRLSPETAARIKALKLEGIVLEKKFSRYYPYGGIGAQIVGYCDFDNKARAGLELEYDEMLKGKSGWSIYLRDALGNQFPNLDFPTTNPVNGLNVETTIDMVYQGILEEELKKAVSQHKASSASAVLLDPLSGEVLGISNYPGFNPNYYNQYSMDKYRNRAITDVYEPGSTFKIIALTLCLEQLKLNLQKELVYCENGALPLAQKVVKDHQKFGYLTAQQVFEKSSNIGVIKLARRFKAPVFYRYARDFGFGVSTGVDLPAEAAGILHKPAEFSRYSLSYLSIGYEVAVTPLQIACAYAAIANDGLLMQPHVVRRVVDQNGKIHTENYPQGIRQVISPATAQRLKEVLFGVVENGTGQNARVSGISIAGKTGTAQKISRKTNSYTSDSHVASFVGFFPVESPRFVMLVVIHNPKYGYYGSLVAAPVFRNIAQRIIGLPVEDREENLALAQIVVDLPTLKDVMFSLEGMEVKKAVKLLKNKDLEYEVVGSGNLIYRQEPAAHSEISERQKVKLYTETKDVSNQQIMPSLTGLTLKEALQILSDWNIKIEVEGSGVVIKQMPGAGKKMDRKDKVKLVCNPA
jgi:cell division protein FtsI/penicillin-binding protein 2